MDTSPHLSERMWVNRIRLHALDWGGPEIPFRRDDPDLAGTALVFLPGWGCTAHIFDRFAPRFTGWFRTLALTRRGHGESDAPESGYDIDTLADDIRGFLDVKEIRRAVLVGHSLAGIEIAHFAAQHPERVMGLVFLDAVYDRQLPGFQAVKEQDPLNTIPRPEPTDAEERSREAYAAYLQRAYPSFVPIWGEVMENEFFYQTLFSPEGKVIYRSPDFVDKAIAETVDRYNWNADKITAPVLNIYADKPNDTYTSRDFMTPEQQVQVNAFFDHVARPWNEASVAAFQRRVPQSQLVRIEQGHHYCFIAQEEQVYAAIRAFLAV